MAGSLRARPSRSGPPPERPAYTLVGTVRVPHVFLGPTRQIARRIGYATAVLAVAVVVVYLGRSGFRDVQGNPLSFMDCVYYASVSLSTTGYGDITPVTPGARALNALVVTPLRIIFLIVLVGTTLAALTEDSRQAYRIQRWRRRVRNHYVVVGYGTKGRTAVDAMVSDGIAPSEIVVVDTDRMAVETAGRRGLVTVQGTASRSDVLHLAGVPRATAVIVAIDRDDTAVLVTLTARELSGTARIVVAAREAENTALLRQSGADTVVVSAETAGRLLGVARTTPNVVETIHDLLTPEAGFAMAERSIEPEEAGMSPRALHDLVVGIERDGRLLRVGTADVDVLRGGDRLLYLRHVAG
ncbi:potassium channel family protein [Rhodococcus coprophilus]|uniref:Potassium transporter n=1 Tax=Rhodococcus coprophilus TaxID=38310 RepID=A0A2X4USP7_9NOCA|nr:potassium channel family protein [Rhodococcus coprophilus]SQI36050.1 potassium transporter [Rhodococcus coprophilus]